MIIKEQKPSHQIEIAYLATLLRDPKGNENQKPQNKTSILNTNISYDTWTLFLKSSFQLMTPYSAQILGHLHLCHQQWPWPAFSFDWPASDKDLPPIFLLHFDSSDTSYFVVLGECLLMTFFLNVLPSQAILTYSEPQAMPLWYSIDFLLFA